MERKKKLEELKKSVLVFDIETCASYPDGRPVDIRADFENYVAYAKCKWFGCYSYKYNKFIGEQVTEDNKEFIKKFIEEHDVICGFNNDEFDTPICYNNELMPKKKFMHVDNLVILGSSSFARHDGLKFKNRGLLMGYPIKKNGLRYIAEAMGLDTQKGDIDYNIFFKDFYTEQEKKEIMKYLEADVMATKEMFDKLWDFWLPFTDWLDEKNIMNLSWIKSSVASLTYKCDCNKLGVEETYGEPNDTVTEEMGGRVIEPKYEEARKVWYVDFASLYPHIDIMFNIFSEIDTNCSLKEGVEQLDKDIWHGNDLFQVKGFYDISEQHILAKDLAEKIAIRMKLKKEDPSNPLIYALKIYANSKYGTQRSSVFEQVYTPNAGWDICWLGQQIQMYTEKRMKDFGFETIAGDTDSIFVIQKEEIKEYPLYDEEYVKYCLNTIVDEIKANVPFPCDTFKIDIEDYIDYIMWPFDMQPIKLEDGTNKKEGNRLVKELKGKKKNYLYLSKDKDGNDKLTIKGLPIIKDNVTLLGKKLLEETIKPMILSNKTAKFDKKIIKDILKEALEKPESLKFLAREFKVKPARTYKPNKDGTPSSVIQAQISEGYFNGEDGVAMLIKNKKFGNAGKTAKYCLVAEAIEQKLTIDDIDLTKIKNELKPFEKN